MKERVLILLITVVWTFSVMADNLNKKDSLDNINSGKPLYSAVTEILNLSVSSNPYILGDEGHACYRIPSLAISQSETILAFAEGRTNDCADDGDIDLVLKRSIDRGQTWGNLITILNPGTNRAVNPCPVVLPSGRILLLYCANPTGANNLSVYVTYSDNDGLTWSTGRSLDVYLNPPGFTWFRTGPCHGIIKKFAPNIGRIIIPANHRENSGANQYSHVIYSDDGGTTWSRGGNVPYTNGNESTVVELSTGEIMLNMRNSDATNDYRVVSVSSDGGKTFPSYNLDYFLVEPTCQGSIIYHSLNTVTGKGNILFSNPNNASSRRNGTIKISTDNAKTWAVGYVYSTVDNIYTSYSDLAIFSNGDVALLHEKGFDNIDGLWFKTLTFKEVGGTTSKVDIVEQNSNIEIHDNMIYVDASSNEGIRIFNTIGTMISSTIKNQLNIEKLKSGIYLVKSGSSTRKFIK
ncbi:MAG: exo-alpha-sialidase [Paludibacter sp.]|jgi:sialidase-1